MARDGSLFSTLSAYGASLFGANIFCDGYALTVPRN